MYKGRYNAALIQEIGKRRIPVILWKIRFIYICTFGIIKHVLLSYIRKKG